MRKTENSPKARCMGFWDANFPAKGEKRVLDERGVFPAIPLSEHEKLKKRIEELKRGYLAERLEFKSAVYIEESVVRKAIKASTENESLDSLKEEIVNSFMANFDPSDFDLLNVCEDLKVQKELKSKFDFFSEIAIRKTVNKLERRLGVEKK